MSKEYVYELELKKNLETIYAKVANFGDLFTDMQVENGVANSRTGFTVKQSALEAAINDYNEDDDLGLEDGSLLSRYGKPKRSKFVNKEIPYEKPWSVFVEFDKHTVNADLDTAVVDALEKETKALIRRFDVSHAKYMKDNAGKEIELSGYTNDQVDKLFDDIADYYNEISVDVQLPKVLKVNSKLHSAILKHPMTVTSKGSTVNIDNGNVTMFRGFIISVANGADNLYGKDVAAYAYVQGMGVSFTGIHDLDIKDGGIYTNGEFLVGSGKRGQYIPEDNLKALVKVKISATPEG